MTAIDASRRLTYSFLQLPYHVKIRIVRELGLVKGKTPLNETDFFAKCFRKAKTDKKLADLWNAVYRETPDAEAKMGENPYYDDGRPASVNSSYAIWEDNFKAVTNAMIKTAEKTGEIQTARFSTNGWKELEGGKGHIRIENIEFTVTPNKKRPA